MVDPPLEPKPKPKGGEQGTDGADPGRFLDPKSGPGKGRPGISVDPGRFLDPKARPGGDPRPAPEEDRFLDPKARPESSVNPNSFLDPNTGTVPGKGVEQPPTPNTPGSPAPPAMQGLPSHATIVPVGPGQPTDKPQVVDWGKLGWRQDALLPNLPWLPVETGGPRTVIPLAKHSSSFMSTDAGTPKPDNAGAAMQGAQPTDGGPTPQGEQPPAITPFKTPPANWWLPPNAGTAIPEGPQELPPPPPPAEAAPPATFWLPPTAGSPSPEPGSGGAPAQQGQQNGGDPVVVPVVNSGNGNSEQQNGGQSGPGLGAVLNAVNPVRGGSGDGQSSPNLVPIINAVNNVPGSGGNGQSNSNPNGGQSNPNPNSNSNPNPNPNLGSVLNAINPVPENSGGGQPNANPNFNPILNAVNKVENGQNGGPSNGGSSNGGSSNGGVPAPILIDPTMTTAAEAYLPTKASGPPSRSSQGQQGDSPQRGGAPDGGIIGGATDIVKSVGGNILSVFGRPDMASRLQENPQGGPVASPGAGGVITTVIEPTPIVTSISGTLTTISRPPEAIIYMPGSRVTASIAGPMVTSSVPEQVLTTRIPGRMVTTSVDGREVVTSLPESLVTTTIPGSVVTTQAPGAMITGYVPGHYVKTAASGSYIVSSVPGSVLTTMIGGQEVLTTLAGSLHTFSVPGYMTTMTTGRSVITTSVPGSEVVSTIAGSLVTSSVPGYMTTMSVNGEVVTTTAPESEVMTTLPGTITTTMINGQLVTTSIPGAVVKTKVPGSTFLTTLPGRLVTTSISGSMITTKLPDSIITTSVSGSTFETTVGGSLVTTSISGSLVVTSLPGSVVRTRVSGTMITTSISGRHVTIPATARPGGTSTAGAAAQATGAYGSGPNRLDRPVRDLTGSRYFAGSYLPTLLAVILRITVGTIYAAVKMMEPFYCLNEPGGATARESLNLYYLQPNRELGTFTAMFRGHWVVLFVSILYLGVGLLVPFSSEFLSFRKFTNIHGAWGPELYVHTTIGRVVQGLLAFAAVSLIGLWFLQRTRRSSGIYSDPSTIATIASLLHHPEVIRDLRQLPPDATSLEMNHLLGDNRYQLGTYRAIDGRDRYGLMPAQGPASRAWVGLRRNEYSRVRGSEDGDSQNGSRGSDERRRPSHQRDRLKRGVNYHHARIARDVMFVILACGILVLILYYWSVGKDSGFERFMDSQSFGPRFVMSLCGMLVHSEWKRVERGELCHAVPLCYL